MPKSEDRGIFAMRGVAANDNSNSEALGSGPPVSASEPGGQAGTGGRAEARVDAAVATLARLIGRRIAREHFESSRAANDNVPGRDAGEK